MRAPLALVILSRILGGSDRNEILGDLEEGYLWRVNEMGQAGARRWLWRQALSVPLRLRADRFLVWAHRHERGGVASSRSGKRKGAAGSAAGGGHPRPGRQDEVRRVGLLEGVVSDVRHAARGYVRTPAFAVIAVGALALGIGATTAIWSVVDGVLVRSLPYPESERLVQIGTILRHDPDGFGSVGAAEFVDLGARTTTLESLAASGSRSFTMLGEGKPRVVSAARVTEEFFRLLGPDAIVGRTLGPDDQRAAATPVVVLNHGFWQSVWGGDPEVVGRLITLDDENYLVVGVMPPDFYPPEALWTQRNVDVWLPLVLFASSGKLVRGHLEYNVIGLVAAGSSIEAARSEADSVFRTIGEEFYNGSVSGARVESLEKLTVSNIADTLSVVLAASAFLLVIACANIANLLLARGTGRQRELALRSVLGAGRRRIVRQLVTEALLLAVVGGIAGTGLAYWGVQAFRSTNPGEIPRLAEVAVDARVLAFALAISLGTGILFGLAPALHFGRTHPAPALQESALTAGTGRRAHRTRSLLVIAQTALAFVLLTGAGLLAHSFVRLVTVDPGFDQDGLATVKLRLPHSFAEGGESRRFFNELHARVRSLPNVDSASLTTHVPYTGDGAMWALVPEGRDSTEQQDSSVFVATISVTPDYFRTMRIPVLSGRGFEDADREGTAPVAIVNEAFAREYWPGSPDVIGKLVRFNASDDPPMTVIGVAGDVRYRPELEALPEVYVPFHQQPSSTMSVVARTRGAAAGLVAVIRQMVWEMDSKLPIRRAATMGEIAFEVNARARFYTLLLAALAGVAVALALVGVYGTLSYAVAQRTREMGIRMALGATSGDIVGLVLGGGFRLALAGVVLGLAGAWATTRLLSGFLFVVTPTDGGTFAVAALLFLTVSLLASWLPARRAARRDPSIALRFDR